MTISQEIQHSIARIQRVMVGRRQSGHRDIRLGLDRIRKVVPPEQHWQGIHVAGTNGKGSICAFLAGLLKLAGISHGSYISPAFPDRLNGVMIDGMYPNTSAYDTEVEHVSAKWERISRGWSLKHSEDAETLSPFELETAIAFRLFNRYKVPYAVVEVGMGGADDATNAMHQKAATVISKIDLDHQEYLGNNIESIARVKAGIMQKTVPCIVDHTNSPAVMRVLRAHARHVGTTIIPTWKAEPFLLTLDNSKWKLEGYQIQNLLCAALAFRHVFPHQEINLNRLMETEPFLPGRLEQVELDPIISGLENPRNVLVDGAHNMLGMAELVRHVDAKVRQDDQPVTWIMGMSSSKHKPFDRMIQQAIKPQDHVAFVEFEPGNNDPQPTPASFGSDIASGIVRDGHQVYRAEPDLKHALPWACERAGRNGPVVVTGSLYMVRDLLKMDGVSRTREPATLKSGLAQFGRPKRIEKKPELTAEEEEDQSDEALQGRTERAAERQKARFKKNGTVPEDDFVKLVHKAIFHRGEEQSYSDMASILREEIDAALADEGAAAGEPSDAQRKQLEEMDKQAAEHKEVFDALILEIRNYPVDAGQKFRGYKKIDKTSTKRSSKSPESPKKPILAGEPGDTDGVKNKADDEVKSE